MKFAALLLAGLLWLLLILMMRIWLTFSYRFQGMESKAVIDFKVLFSHLRVEINIPQEMLTEGFKNIFSNITEESAEPGKEKADQAKRQRYMKLRHYQGEVGRHFVYSWSRLIWIKRKLHRLYRNFYRKVNIYSFQASIQVGGRDAAETGLLTGAFWALLGGMAARLHRLVTIKKKDIRLNVLPCFEQETFLCQLNCILTMRISHIIFIVYKFMVFIIKNRRIRTYGRTSH